MKFLISFLLISTLAVHAQDAPKPTFVKKGLQTEVTVFHNNGTIAQQGFLRNNKIHGQWVSYDADGNKTMLGVYHKGKKIGKWFFWSAEGVVEVDFDNNKPNAITRWTDQSQRIVDTN